MCLLLLLVRFFCRVFEIPDWFPFVNANHRLPVVLVSCAEKWYGQYRFEGRFMHQIINNMSLAVEPFFLLR